MAVRVLSWNLKHGRAVPSAGRHLLDEFTAALAGWEWDVAVLQEVSPWWPAAIARRTESESRSVLTSRNWLLALRRGVAIRWPDIIKSDGGGANAILVRGAEVLEHRIHRLCLVPERRWVHGVLAHGGPFGQGVWIANLHATAHDAPAAARDSALAAQTALRWATGRPCVIAGDFNLRELSLEGFAHAGGHDVDHIFMRRLEAAGAVSVLERGHLSDHAPVLAALRAPA